MDRRSKIVIGLFVVVLLGIIITEIVRPKPLNWKPSYTASDKIPFGCFILYSELGQLFPDTDISKIDETIYEVLSQRDTKKTTNLMLINNTINMDEQETHKLLDYVDKGNDVFIASTYFSYTLSDTLNVNVNSYYGIKEDSVTVSLTNKKFSQERFYYTKGQNESYFSRIDTTQTTILGHIAFKEDKNLISGPKGQSRKEANFIQVKFGDGNFYLNTLPIAYTNYYLLKGQKDYVSHTFSYLRDRPLFWDNYKKSGRIVIDSPMRFVLTQASLKWAYYLTIVGLVIFVIFKAKREQRIIPVIEPLENSSVEFAKTVGSLYHQNKDFSNLIFKKLNYFLEFVRSRYYLDTNTINDKTAQDLASKSGKSITETKELLDMILYLKDKKQHTEQDLIELNKKITAFKQ
ncbi:DUF4350 domain-containing protein [Costertonia aggregata]|uniref:DUF4350 domain-containing protein n=1 Tax=Costertonia aggregata TaxID=343403 RepID=A0A7H9ASK1_9FLAO|nr:DUF4350 domain-containing protein [Costertonia aggregata]QLG46420.1 DUF4350 domain-containing protein [Costertonia aggregata]